MLQTAYYGVANRLERIDFPSIWPGFSSGSFALYQGKLACLSGQLVPRPPEFRGNTSILWQGSPLAIWNLEQEMDLDQLASYLVHELFDTQIGVKNSSMAGGGVKKYMEF